MNNRLLILTSLLQELNKDEIEEYLIEIGEKKLLGVFNAKRTIMNKIDGIYDFLNKMKELGYIVSYKDKGQTIIVKTN